VGTAVTIPAALWLHGLLPSGVSDLGPAMLTGLIEEATKVLAVAWLMFRRRYRFELDGIVFGAAAGMVFSGIEDMGYAVTALLVADTPEDAIREVLGVVWLRLITSFFGHPVWTALICGAIWRGKGAGAPQWDWQVAGSFVLAVVLHGLWDWSIVFMLPVAILGTLLLRYRIQRASEAEYQSLRSLGLARPERRAATAGDPDGTEDRRSVVCPVCGFTGPAGAMYCLRCGAALSRPSG
jgi:RsiW-degrading membrane proteinase PrsW (M82 family)